LSGLAQGNGGFRVFIPALRQVVWCYNLFGSTSYAPDEQEAITLRIRGKHDPAELIVSFFKPAQSSRIIL